MENDLADRLDDLICAFDAGFDTATNNIDTIVFVLLAWVVLAVSVYIIVYRLFKTNQPSDESLTDDVADGSPEKSEVAEPPPAKKANVAEIPAKAKEEPVKGRKALDDGYL